MSNKKETKKPAKAIIAAVIAVVLVAAVLLGVFVIKPAINKNKGGTTDITFTDAEKIEGEHYDYVNFGNTRMAKELALMLKQAEEDSNAAIENGGVAVEIGNHKISQAELTLYYIDTYTAQVKAVEDSIATRGQNLTGFETDKLPSEQKHHDDDFNWSDKFISEAIESAKVIYTTFDLAVDAGYLLDEQEIYNLITSYTRVERFSGTDRTPDELIQSIYGENVTYAMFARWEIMQTYAVLYEAFMAQNYFNGFTDEEVKAELAEDADSFKAMDLRVYPIQGEYTEDQIAAIRTEQDFLDFATNNYPLDGYNAEVVTKIFNMPKYQIESSFGPEVAEWAFSAERKVGDVSVITGQLYEYVVYVAELPVYDYSHDVLFFSYLFVNNETAEQKKSVIDSVQAVYDKFKGQQITAEEFESYFIEAEMDCQSLAARSTDFYFEVVNWMLDTERKPGDMEMFSHSDEGIYVVYYLKANPEDTDWEYTIRTGLSNEKYVADYEEFAKDYKVKENSKVIKDVIKNGDAKIKEKIEASANQ